MLADALPYLCCPICAADLTLSDRSLRCPAGHSFDVARQGYVTLLTGFAGPGTGDSAAMVAARAEFLAAGHYSPVVAALAAAADPGPGAVLDLGAGTGHYLAGVLDALPHRVGLALDLSRYALRRAARAHPRIAAVGADTWRPLPVRTGSVGLVLNVFAPRNAAEIHRVLAADGQLLVVTPTPDHLRELVDALGLVGVDADKPRRLADGLAGFEPGAARRVEFTMRLGHAAAATVVGMGPSARHLSADALADRIAALPDPVEVTASVTVAAYRP
ncbi:putative RNA methyltransferase [Actinocatenispora rupis]|uniref:Ubiquinone biosynthesis protein n=1 Tax=Actinocatenispora rupis TaxID=519421 RepID=A0A8J3J183_9ACTN|nr:methyltransferase domain-containing protein [Actinocatenispora rupis]GID12690.1 ubiquinone biosynthesis protein [Actinocatenispora rupis]